MATIASFGPGHRAHRRSDGPCAMCAEAARPAAAPKRDTRFAPLADALLPWLLVLGIAAPLAVVFDGAERWFAAGVTVGILAGAAFAWQLHVKDRATAHAATKRVRAEMAAEAEVRADTLIRQFEWAVNDISALREKADRAEKEAIAAEARVVQAQRRIRRLERDLWRDRVPGAPAPTAPLPAAHPHPTSVELKWRLNDDGPLAWLDLDGDDPDALPARVRVFAPEGTIVAVSDPAVHGVTRDGARSASLALPAPPALADALRSGELEEYRFEALVAHRWIAVRLAAHDEEPQHRDKRGRVWRRS